jgi:2',3'-cyclic-nucleotide 2'-phosphodiesterase (5'-nucleotidase family)
VGGTIVKEFSGVKVAIVPVAQDTTPEVSSPGDWKFAPTVASALDAARRARSDGADLVIGVIQAPHSYDDEILRAHVFDLFVSGDDHDYRAWYDGVSAYVDTSTEANYLAPVDLNVVLTPAEGDKKRSVTWTPNFRFIDTASVEPDPETQAVVDQLSAKLSAELDVVIGTTANPLDSRRNIVRGQESAMGNLIADAMRGANGADIAITNGGGIRADKEYPAGTSLTRKDIFTELPFGNVTVVTQISGQAVLDALENGFSQIEDGAGRFPQVSGLVVEVDPSKAAGSRVLSVLVNDKPLDPAATYTLATNDFMLNGGDGYTAFTTGKVLIGPKQGNLMASDVINYIEAAGAVKAQVEGRIVMK